MIASTTIEQLAENLRRFHRGEDDVEIVRWLHATAPQIASLPKPQACDPARRYSRTLLHRGDGFELVAIHWDSQCVTPIHDHGGALCWLSVAGGSMKVDNYLRIDTGETAGYARIALEGREELGVGGVDYRQDDVHLHRCVTNGTGAITLHVYAHPIGAFYTFDEARHTCTQVLSSYDAMPIA